MGDFNARLGIITDDNTENNNGTKFLNYINKYKMDILNNLYTPGVRTFWDNKNKGSSSIIDYAVCDNTKKLINNFKIETNALYKSHKPLILHTKDIPMEIIEKDKIYSFGYNISDNPDVLNIHKNFIKKNTKHIQKISKHITNNTDYNPIISKIITKLTLFTLQKRIIITNGIKTINSYNNWHNSNIDIVDINSRLKIAMHNKNSNDPKIKKLYQQLKTEYNNKVNEISKNRINYKTNQINNAPLHEKTKIIKKIIPSTKQLPITTITPLPK